MQFEEYLSDAERARIELLRLDAWRDLRPILEKYDSCWSYRRFVLKPLARRAASEYLERFLKSGLTEFLPDDFTAEGFVDSCIREAEESANKHPLVIDEASKSRARYIEEVQREVLERKANSSGSPRVLVPPRDRMVGLREPSDNEPAGAAVERHRGQRRAEWLDAQLSAHDGWSDVDLANNGGPTYNTIQRYRSGRSSNQDLGVRSKLAKALKVDVSVVPE